MKYEINRRNVGFKAPWPETRYYALIDGETVGIRLRLDLLGVAYIVVAGVFDFETDTLIREGHLCCLDLTPDPND